MSNTSRDTAMRALGCIDTALLLIPNEHHFVADCAFSSTEDLGRILSAATADQYAMVQTRKRLAALESGIDLLRADMQAFVEKARADDLPALELFEAVDEARRRLVVLASGELIELATP